MKIVLPRFRLSVLISINAPGAVSLLSSGLAAYHAHKATAAQLRQVESAPKLLI